MSAAADSLEERIRIRAYYLWQADGCPEGRAQEFWERARELTAIEDNPSAGLVPNPTTRTGASPGPAQPVEPIEAVENQGEFPDRFTDQGERRQAPQRRRRR